MKLLLFGLILFSAGCGYHFPGQGGSLPGDVERIHLALFENATREPFLENSLTTTLSDLLSRRSDISLVPLAEAEAELQGRIRSYDSRSIAYAEDDLISQYRASMVVEVKLIERQTETLLWDGTVRWQTEYDAAADKMLQGDEERQAQEELARRLAEEIYFRLLDEF
ncbi:MAG: LptE family protein [Pelovirga sp.]